MLRVPEWRWQGGRTRYHYWDIKNRFVAVQVIIPHHISHLSPISVPLFLPFLFIPIFFFPLRPLPLEHCREWRCDTNDQVSDMPSFMIARWSLSPPPRYLRRLASWNPSHFLQVCSFRQSLIPDNGVVEVIPPSISHIFWLSLLDPMPYHSELVTQSFMGYIARVQSQHHLSSDNCLLFTF